MSKSHDKKLEVIRNLLIIGKFIKSMEFTRTKYKLSTTEIVIIMLLLEKLNIYNKDIIYAYEPIYNIANDNIDYNDILNNITSIYNHLKENGKALVIAMGDGKKEYSSDVNNAFLNSERININNNKKVLVANTSCKIKNMAGMIKEIKKGNLRIIKNEIINDLPGFAECESFILEINNQNLN